MRANSKHSLNNFSKIFSYGLCYSHSGIHKNKLDMIIHMFCIDIPLSCHKVIITICMVINIRHQFNEYNIQ